MSTGQQGEAQGRAQEDTTPLAQSVPDILRSYARIVNFTAHAEHLMRAAELIEALAERGTMTPAPDQDALIDAGGAALSSALGEHNGSEGR